MRFAPVSATFWTSRTVQALSLTSKLVALYLITCTHGNAAGVFHLPLGYVCADLGIEPEAARVALAALANGYEWDDDETGNPIGMGFATYCDRTGWVVIHKSLKHLGKINAKYAAHIFDRFDQLPRDATNRLVAARALTRYGDGLPAQERDALVAKLSRTRPVKAPPANPTPIPSESDPNVTGYKGTGTGTGKGTNPLPATPAVSPGRAEAAIAPTVLTWESYRRAYEDRYGVAPVRNARVNAHMARLVAIVGSEEAPAVAEFFLGVNEQFYVQNGHATGVLVKDAEKLRMMWATGRRVVAPERGETLAERRARNMAAITGQDDDRRTVEGSATRVDREADLPKLPDDLRGESDVDVGRRR